MSNVYLDFKNTADNGHRIYTNLITHLETLFDWNSITTNEMKEYILENYNGVYVIQINRSNHLLKHYIRFSDPKDMTAFILRFGGSIG